MILSYIYCFLFWVGRWYLLSTCVCTDPYLYLFSLLIVECSKRAVVFNSTATLASLHYSGYQGELMLLAWTESSSSCLDALKFRHVLAFIYFSFLDTLRLLIWDRCSCDDDFQILGIIIVVEFLEVIELVFINEFKSSALLSIDIILKCWVLYWLVRSHSRISVGATRGSNWVMTNLVSEH